MPIYRENCIALLGAFDRFKEKRIQIVSSAYSSCEALTSAIPEDDAAAIISPMISNAAGKINYMAAMVQERLMKGFVRYANDVFPNNPVSYSPDESMGYEERPIPSEQDIKTISEAAVSAWTTLQGDMMTLYTELNETATALWGAYQGNKEYLEPGTAFMQEFDERITGLVKDLADYSNILKGYGDIAGNTAEGIRNILAGGSSGNP